MFRWSVVGVLLSLWTIDCQSHAALVVNPAQPITNEIRVNVIAVADNDGSDSTAGMLGNSTRRAQVLSLVDVIFAQAGVELNVTMRPGTYNSSFARSGTPGNNSPRPSSDLGAIYGNAAAAGGVLSSDPNTINLFLVSIVPGFSQLSSNYAAGIATVGGNGIAFYGGATLSTYPEGREVLASVFAHEIGHNLGLNHTSLPENLMRSGGGPDDGERLTPAQINTIISSRFTVPLPPPTFGDFNGDEIVDGDDFLIWQRGQSPSRLSPGDLAAWESHFGTNATVHADASFYHVPEPESLALAMMAFAALIIGAKHSRCRSN
jgi:hypothetical protein